MTIQGMVITVSPTPRLHVKPWAVDAMDHNHRPYESNHGPPPLLQLTGCSRSFSLKQRPPQNGCHQQEITPQLRKNHQHFRAGGVCPLLLGTSAPARHQSLALAGYLRQLCFRLMTSIINITINISRNLPDSPTDARFGHQSKCNQHFFPNQASATD